jgi:uncharacterized membrane protein YkvA (DUF1232 family)
MLGWVIAATVGVCMVAVTVGLLATVSRLLPAGRIREVVGFVPNCVVLLRAARADRRLPRRGRLALSAAFGYVASPVQLIPNFVPVIGQIDDVIIVTWALRYACRRLPTEMLEAAWTGDPDTLDRLLGRPRS